MLLSRPSRVPLASGIPFTGLLVLRTGAKVESIHCRLHAGNCARGTSDRDYPFKPVPFTAVHLNDVFWAPRIETNRKVTIPFAFQQCELSGRVANFERAAEALRGQLGQQNAKLPGNPFDDTDIYKVIEGASYTLSVQPDPQLDAYVDGLIAKIAAAQEPDGYLYTAHHLSAAPARMVRRASLGKGRGSQPRIVRSQALV
jgi:DUF1680 family protein